MIRFTINNSEVSFEGDEATPLLWVIRDHLNMTGTKYGCGVGLCGHCQWGPPFVCKDGPIFPYSRARPLLKVWGL